MVSIHFAKAQIPVEIFTGQKRTTLDVMFFKYFKRDNSISDNTEYHWLFFNRNRASIDYRMTSTQYLPQFGFTEAISYNHKHLKGFAPVIVAQILSWGVYSKAGIQYAHIQKQMTIFSWIVAETQSRPEIDYFLLCRFTPQLSSKVHLFAQVETINTYNAFGDKVLSLTQRGRLGLQLQSFQFGAGIDCNQTGYKTYTNTNNIGGFIRHEF